MKSMDTIKWRNYSLLAIAVILPFFPKFLTPFIVLNFIVGIFDYSTSGKKMMWSLNPVLLFLSLYFILHLIGLGWTTNYKYAGLDLQLKLPLLLIPITFVFTNHDYSKIRDRILDAFVYSLAFAVVFCFTRATYFYFAEGLNYYMYKDFSFFIHPGYFSMFLCFGVAVVLNNVFNSQISVRGNNLNLLFITLFSLAIICLEAKAGIFIILIILAVNLLILIKSGVVRKYKISAFLLLITIGIYYFGFISPYTSGRMSEMKTGVSSPATTEVHSTGMRLQAWKSAIELIKANPLAGTGTGDVKDELVKVYYQKGYTEIYNLKLNAHNQFLQSFASLGVLGFLFLIMVMLAATVNAVKTRNWLLFSFTGIVAANMMIESVLEVSAGAAFVSLFFPLLLSFNTTKIND